MQTLNNIQIKNTLPNQFIICHMGCKNHILHEPARKGHVLGGVYTSYGQYGNHISQLLPAKQCILGRLYVS